MVRHAKTLDLVSLCTDFLTQQEPLNGKMRILRTVLSVVERAVQLILVVLMILVCKRSHAKCAFFRVSFGTRSSLCWRGRVAAKKMTK